MDLENDEIDIRGDISDDIMFEIEENYNLNVISNFKKTIINYPEFYGINNISSYEILLFIEEDNIVKNKIDLDKEVFDYFDDLYLELFGEVSNFSKYKTVVYKIFNRIYV